MSSKIQKWGNSLGIRIPKAVIEKTGLSENSEVNIDEKDGVILIKPAKVEYSLDSLVRKISKEDLHKEEKFISEGNEAW